MGFFSKKISEENKDDTHEIVDAKIHVMQYDLDEIAKNGHVEIEEPVHKESSKHQKQTSKISSENNPAPLNSPFSQPSYPMSDDISAPSFEIPQTPKETIQQEAPVKEMSSSKKMESQPMPITHPAEPLDLPLFQAAPAPRRPLHLNIDGQTPVDTFPKKPANQKPAVETSESPANPQESSRTGNWSVESPAKTVLGGKSDIGKTPTNVHLQKTSTNKEVMSDNIILKEHWGWKHFSLIIIILGAIGGGAFYFWKTRLSMEEVATSTITHPNIPDISLNNSAKVGNVRTEPDTALPFSTTNANPFLIDVETETVSTLREQLVKNAEIMKQANMTGPVPFSVVDKTNTPIAFFIFASIFNLGFSGDLLNSLDNNFTLSLFLDNGEPRTTLTITAKNSTDAQRYLSASEKALPLSLKNIVLVDTPPTVPEAAFVTTLYRDIAIRYFNLSTEPPLSFDYALIGNTLIIGTSKNAERAGIDTVLDSKK